MKAFVLLILTASIMVSAEEPAGQGSVPGHLAKWVTQDRLDPPAAGSVLFIGSSSIRRWDSLARDFADYHVIQRGWGGSWLAEMDEAFPHVVLPCKPAAIVMWAGTNDLSGGRSGEQVHDDFLTFLRLLRRHLPTTPFLYLGATPTLANAGTTAARKTANSLIEATIETDPHAYYIDLAAHFEALGREDLEKLYVDPIHLNRAGYAVWLGLIRPRLEEVLKPNKTFVANPDAPAAGDRVLFDFGPHDALRIDGHATEGPDADGRHWNNWFPVDGGARITSGEHKAGLVNADGRPNGMRWTITGGFVANGLRNGGLVPPHGPAHDLLGGLAVATATEDYFFSTADDRKGGGDDDLPGGFMLSGLNPELAYTFRFFGTRADTDVRMTEYAVHGSGHWTATLRTSGADIGSDGSYDGNDDEIAVIEGVRPDAFGQVFVDMLAIEGGFAYLGAMEIDVSKPGASGGSPR